MIGERTQEAASCGAQNDIYLETMADLRVVGDVEDDEKAVSSTVSAVSQFLRAGSYV